MRNITLSRWSQLARKNEKGQVLVEGLFVMIFLTGLLLVLMGSIKKQNEVFKKYELPAKIKYKNR